MTKTINIPDELYDEIKNLVDIGNNKVSKNWKSVDEWASYYLKLETEIVRDSYEIESMEVKT